MKKIFFVFLFFCIIPNATFAQSPIPTKREEIIRLMKQTGIIKKIENYPIQLKKTINAVVEKKLPTGDEKLLNKSSKIIQQTVSGNKKQLINMLIPIYDNKFSQDEIREMNLFLSSDVGKKFMKNNIYISSQIEKLTLIWTEQTTAKALEKINNMLKDYK